jgi:hypothetical protein
MSDMLHAVEAAIFLIAALGAERPMSCAAVTPRMIECGHHGTVSLASSGLIVLPGGVRLDRSRRDILKFTNGVEGKRGATGWVTFSNGIVVRREGNSWRFGGGLVCTATSLETASCR